jgi:IS1 family transposase
VRRPKAPRWLWQAIAHRSGPGLAAGCGRRQADVLGQLHALLEPGGLTQEATDAWGAYTRPREGEQPQPGQRHPQQSARKPLPLRPRRKRLARQPIGFAKSRPMQDMVLGLCVKRSAFGFMR